MTKNAVAVKKANEVATYDDDFASYAGAGMENVTAKDILIPRLTILQTLSPQLNARKPEYVKDSKEGDICDVALGEVFPDGLLFLPCYFRKDFLEWAPRNSGGGLVSIHSDPDILNHAIRQEKGSPKLPNGNLIVETAQFFGLNLTAGCRMTFIPMASTQLKKARAWLTLATGEKLTRADGSSFTPPLFYRAYKLTSAEESKNADSWMGWKVDRGPTLPELGDTMGMDWRAIKEMAVKFREQLMAGEVRGDTGSMETVDAEAAM